MVLRVHVYLLPWIALGLFGFSTEPGRAAGPATMNTNRVVAIGDLHADLDAARSAFRLAGAIGANDDWVGGDLVVVQLGDFIGRSIQDREVLDFILDVREKAEAGGGKVHVLIGNHEIFGAQLRIDYVPDEAFPAYDDIASLDLDHPRLADLPPEKRARSAALMPGGTYSRRLADFPAVLRLGNTVFAHGGVTPHWARYGIEKINREFSQWFAGRTDQPASARGVDAGHLDDNVTMSRHFSADPDDDDCAMLEESLSILGATRMIVAHTVLDTITTFCDGRVWAIDVGMSRYYEGQVQVLEIVDDTSVAVITRQESR